MTPKNKFKFITHFHEDILDAIDMEQPLITEREPVSVLVNNEKRELQPLYGRDIAWLIEAVLNIYMLGCENEYYDPTPFYKFGILEDSDVSKFWKLDFYRTYYLANYILLTYWHDWTDQDGNELINFGYYAGGQSALWTDTRHLLKSYPNTSTAVMPSRPDNLFEYYGFIHIYSEESNKNYPLIWDDWNADYPSYSRGILLKKWIETFAQYIGTYRILAAPILDQFLWGNVSEWHTTSGEYTTRSSPPRDIYHYTEFCKMYYNPPDRVEAYPKKVHQLRKVLSDDLSVIEEETDDYLNICYHIGNATNIRGYFFVEATGSRYATRDPSPEEHSTPWVDDYDDDYKGYVSVSLLLDEFITTDSRGFRILSIPFQTLALRLKPMIMSATGYTEMSLGSDYSSTTIPHYANAYITYDMRCAFIVGTLSNSLPPVNG